MQGSTQVGVHTQTSSQVKEPLQDSSQDGEHTLHSLCIREHSPAVHISYIDKMIS